MSPARSTSWHRLGDRHEVAGHLRVGHGDRAAALDLALEDRHDAAAGAEDVAEADERRSGRPECLLPSLDDEFRDSLGGPHDRLRGLTALSVETRTKRSTRRRGRRPRPRLRVPSTLFVMASPMFSSISGTCLWAAAWNTTSGRIACRTRDTRSRSRMSAEHGLRRRRESGALDLSLSRRSGRGCPRVAQRWHQVSSLGAAYRGVLAAKLGADGAAGTGHEDVAITQVSKTGEVGICPSLAGRGQQVARPVAVAPTNGRRRTCRRSSSNTVRGGCARGSRGRGRQQRRALRSSPAAEGIAITTSSGSVSSRIAAISSVEPSTLTPASASPACAGRRR